MHWIKASRPYYKVYPSITKALSKLNLDIPITSIPKLADHTIAVRFADQQEPSAGGHRLRSILMSRAEVRYLDGRPNGEAFIILYVIDSDVNQTLMRMPILPGLSIASSIARCENEDEEPISNIVIRICMTLCLLGNDPSIINPEVLTDDQQKFKESNDQRLVAKARKRGVVGWNVGADYEVCPHYRRPHFALRHTGKGGAVSKIVPVKGAIVHRSKLTDVPTGYLLPDGREVEGVI
mgnify:CR=1 FL=1